MSSTDKNASKGNDAIDRFFDGELMPLASRLRASDPGVFLAKVDPAAESYYVKRTKRTMSKADFEVAACVDGAEFARRLAAHWNACGCGALAPLAPSIGKIADAVRVEEHDNADVSPFVYVMF
jgi:hypothetical protein